MQIAERNLEEDFSYHSSEDEEASWKNVSSRRDKFYQQFLRFGVHVVLESHSSSEWEPSENDRLVYQRSTGKAKSKDTSKSTSKGKGKGKKKSRQREEASRILAGETDTWPRDFSGVDTAFVSASSSGRVFAKSKLESMMHLDDESSSDELMDDKLPGKRTGKRTSSKQSSSSSSDADNSSNEDETGARPTPSFAAVRSGEPANSESEVDSPDYSRSPLTSASTTSAKTAVPKDERAKIELENLRAKLGSLLSDQSKWKAKEVVSVSKRIRPTSRAVVVPIGRWSLNKILDRKKPNYVKVNRVWRKLSTQEKAFVAQYVGREDFDSVKKTTSTVGMTQLKLSFLITKRKKTSLVLCYPTGADPNPTEAPATFRDVRKERRVNEDHKAEVGQFPSNLRLWYQFGFFTPDEDDHFENCVRVCLRSYLSADCPYTSRKFKERVISLFHATGGGRSQAKLRDRCVLVSLPRSLHFPH